MKLCARGKIITVSDILIEHSDVIKAHCEFNKKYEKDDIFELDFNKKDVFLLMDYLDNRIYLDDLSFHKYKTLKILADFLCVKIQYNVDETIMFQKIYELFAKNLDSDEKFNTTKNYIEISKHVSDTWGPTNVKINGQNISMYNYPNYHTDGFKCQDGTFVKTSPILFYIVNINRAGEKLFKCNEFINSLKSFWDASDNHKKILATFYIEFVKRM